MIKRYKGVVSSDVGRSVPDPSDSHVLRFSFFQVKFFDVAQRVGTSF